MLSICEIWGFHNGDYEEYNHLLHAGFYPEDGGDTFLRKVGSHKKYTAPHPRKRHSSCYQ
jgi:hypothetical protein